MHTNKDSEDRLLKQCLNLSTYWASAKRADPVLQVVEEANTGGRATVPRATTVFISTVHLARHTVGAGSTWKVIVKAFISFPVGEKGKEE